MDKCFQVESLLVQVKIEFGSRKRYTGSVFSNMDFVTLEVDWKAKHRLEGMDVTRVPACHRMPGSGGRVPGKNSVLGSPFSIQGLKQNLPYGTVSSAFSPEPSLRQVWAECSLVTPSVSQDLTHSKRAQRSQCQRQEPEEQVSERCRTFSPQQLEVLPSTHFFSERFWGGEGVSTQTPHRQHRLCWRKSKCREQNACSGTCNTDPVFHPSSDPVHDMSAFNSCPSLSRQAVEAAPGEFAFWKKPFQEKFAT